jgi:hypothetical protein
VAIAPLVGAAILWATIMLVLPCAAGMLAPRFLIMPYRIWNRLARVYAGYAETVVLRISFFAVCVPAGWGGPRIQIMRPPLATSLWLSREVRRPAGPPISAHKENEPAQTWIGRYVAWAWQSGEPWRLVLLPYLIVLGTLTSSEQETTVPENIYTLF